MNAAVGPSDVAADAAADERELDASRVALVRTAAILSLVITALLLLGRLSPGRASPDTSTSWLTMHPGAAVLLVTLAAVVLVVNHGWTRLGRRLTLLAVAVPMLSVLANIALELGLAGTLGGPREGIWRWVAGEQTAVAHLLLGIVLFATPRRGRVVGHLRAAAWLLAVLAPAASLSTRAYTAGGYSLIPGVPPPTGMAAVLALVMAVAVAAVAPHRWPVRALVRDARDLVLVRRLLPFIAMMPVIGPTFMATARFAGAATALTAVVGTLGPSVILIGLLGVTLRDHRALTEELETHDQQLRTLLDGLPQAVYLHAENGTLVHLNSEGRRVAEHLRAPGMPADEAATSFLERTDLVGVDGAPLDVPALPGVHIGPGGRSEGVTLGVPGPDGAVGWYSVRGAPVPLDDGTTGTVVTCADVTELQAARGELALAARSLRLTFEHAPIGIAVVEVGGRVIHVNTALRDLLGHPDGSTLAAGFWEAMHPDDHEDDLRLRADCLSGRRHRYLGERRFRHVSGHWIWTQLSVALIRDDDGTPARFVAQVVDLSERRALEEELRLAAVQDPLTGLLNRRALSDRLEAADRRRSRTEGAADIGLLYLDLDGFKAINDRHGHEVGDLLLIEVAHRLTIATREVDTVCRIGGDEFVVLCAPIDGEHGLMELAGRLERMPPISVEVDGSPVEVGASIGATLLQRDESLGPALQRADAAMYRVKRAEGDAGEMSGLHLPASRFPSERPPRYRVG